MKSSRRTLNAGILCVCCGFIVLQTYLYQAVGPEHSNGFIDGYSITQSEYTNARLKRNNRNELPNGNQTGVNGNPQTSTPFHSNKSTYQIEPDVRLLQGHHRSQQGFLTIGLCTVPRQNVSYLTKTIASLITHMTAKDKNNTVIVIFLGSFNSTWVKHTLANVSATFSKDIDNGLMQVIQPHPRIYPDLRNITKKNIYNDTMDRVRWRTKQNIDFAHLFSYCQNISKYYVHIEDDIISAKEYISDIKKFIDKYDKKAPYWFCLELSRLGFIGKLFRSSDLQKINEYLLLFKMEKPGDLLMLDLLHIMSQQKRIISAKSLFQHIGFVSSLDNKIQNLTDLRFKDRHANSMLKGFSWTKTRTKKLTENPKAVINTSIETFGKYKPSKAYIRSERYFFWGKTPSVNDFFEIRLEQVTRLKEIHIRTGHPEDTNKDTLVNANISLGKFGKRTSRCVSLRGAKPFIGGEVHVFFPVPTQVECIIVVVTEPHTHWVIIRDITLV